MLRPASFLIALAILIIGFASSCTTSRACSYKINKKKLDYYNGLQYRGARKN